MRPASIAPAFKVIEPQVVFEFAVLLFDGPAGARQRDEVCNERSGRG